jgi:hypothetical protein
MVHADAGCPPARIVVVVSERLCLRCDWNGEDRSSACPDCGAPLYRLGDPGSKREEASSSAAPPPSPIHDPAPAFPLEAPGIDERPPAQDISSGRKTTVIVVAFIVAAIGMVGSLIERTARDVPWHETAERPQAAAPSVVGSPTDPPIPTPEAAPGACVPGTSAGVSAFRTTIEGGGAALTADYRFGETLSSSVGESPPLLALGGGPVRFIGDEGLGRHRTVLGFGPNGGLSFPHASGLIDDDGYTIELLFRFDRLNGYRKIVDFEDGVADDGLYSFDGCLTFYPRTAEARASIRTDRYVHLVLTRSASGMVLGYVNSRTVFAFADLGGHAVVPRGGSLRFFIDDETTESESSGGAVARIRLYDGPITGERIRKLCAGLLPEACGPPTAAYIAEVAEICGEATDRFFDAVGRLGSSLEDQARWSEVAVRIADHAMAELRALPAPRGVPRGWLEATYALLEPPIDILRRVPAAASAGDAERVRDLLWERVQRTHSKDRLVLEEGRSWLGLTLESCPIALGA